MNKVWDAWMPAGCALVRACVEALLQGPEKKVEIQVRPFQPGFPVAIVAAE
jgi:hypothetical protein